MNVGIWVFMVSTTWMNMAYLAHYNDVIQGAMVSQITNLTMGYSTIYSRRKSKKISKLRVTGLCEGNSPVTGEFPAQRTSNAGSVSIWWRHHEYLSTWLYVILRLRSSNSSSGTSMFLIQNLINHLNNNSYLTGSAEDWLWRHVSWMWYPKGKWWFDNSVTKKVG